MLVDAAEAAALLPQGSAPSRNISKVRFRGCGLFECAPAEHRSIHSRFYSKRASKAIHENIFDGLEG